MDHRTEMLQDKAHTDVAFPGPAKGRETAGGVATVAVAPACPIPPTILYNEKMSCNSQIAL